MVENNQEVAPLAETPDHRKARYETQIARLSGTLVPADIDEVELDQLSGYLRGQPLPPEIAALSRKYLGRVFSTADREAVEMGNELLILREGYKDLPLYESTFGRFYPSYIPAMQEYQQSNEHIAKPRVLMVGALTPTTVQEFVQGVQATIGSAAESHVIDIAGARTAHLLLPRYHFHKGNIITSQVPPRTFDIVTTNFLLPFILAPYPENMRGEIEHRFAQQVYRLLKPEGELALVEAFSNDNLTANQRQIARLQTALQEAGFRDVSASAARSFTKRKYIDQFSVDAARGNPHIDGTAGVHIHSCTKFIRAVKPKKGRLFRVSK